MDTVIKIGEQAPVIQLYSLEGKLHNLEGMVGRIVVLYFWSAECDWCSRVDQELVHHQAGWNDRVEVWWIASNANEGRDMIKQVVEERGLPVVLIDDNQVAADLYGAETTPHFFIIDQEGQLRYQGAWDDITFRQRIATQKYVPVGVDALIDGRTPEITQTHPYGCVLVRYKDAAS